MFLKRFELLSFGLITESVELFEHPRKFYKNEKEGDNYEKEIGTEDFGNLYCTKNLDKINEYVQKLIKTRGKKNPENTVGYFAEKAKALREFWTHMVSKNCVHCDA